jgi:hypothetical protein
MQQIKFMGLFSITYKENTFPKKEYSGNDGLSERKYL